MLSPRVKRLAQEQVEVVDSQSELPIHLGGFIIQVSALQAPGRSPEAGAQGRLFVIVAQLPQQAPNLVGPLVSGVDDTPGRIGLSAVCLHALEQEALEVAAVIGAVSINPASAAVKSRARLLQARNADGGVRSGNGQAQRTQPGRVVAGRAA